MIQKKNQYLLLLLLISISVKAQFVHPGISHKLSDLERMKHMVEAGVEPYATSYEKMKSDNKASYSYPINVVNQDPDYITDYSSSSKAWFKNDGTAAYYNSLMWYITGDSRHADKAIEILNVWNGLVRNTSGIPLESGRVWRIIEAAEIIAHTYHADNYVNGWKAVDIQAFKDMLVYPGYSNTTVPTTAIANNDITFYWKIYQGDPARHGNQGLFAMRTMMAMSIFLDNEIMYDRTVRYLKGESHREDDLAYPSGPSINSTTNISGCDYFEEYNRSGEATTITDYGYNEVISNYVFENGQSQESSRDQAHALAGVGTISIMAEMAWSQGDDLYGHLDNRPLLGLEFFYRYNLSHENSYPDQASPWEPTVASGEYIERTDRSGRWKALKINPFVNCDETNLTRGGNNLMPMYEMNLGHYKDRMNLPADDYKWLQRGLDHLTAEIGVEGEGVITDHASYGGLTFRRVSPGDPIKGFDTNGLPAYKMNELPMTIEAENFDYFVLNGQEKTYYDISTNNTGGEYRTDEGVDLKVCSESGFALTDINSGEWLTYTANVPVNGTYDISIRYASANANGKIKFNIDGTDITSEVTVPHGSPNSTGITNWQDYKVASKVRLSKGVQVVKVAFSGVNNAFELNNFKIDLAAEDVEPTNLALNGTATQSSTGYDGPAELAIDGNTDGNYGNGSVTHTGANDTNSWWQVMLESESVIDNINIYNRTGGNYGLRLSHFRVTVFNEAGTTTFTNEYTEAPSPFVIIDTDGVVGKTVKIELLTGSGGMNLAEVEVFGIKVTELSTRINDLDNVRLFPNPVINYLNITNSKGATIQIFNLVGQLVFSETIKNNEHKVDMTHRPSGIYLVRMSKNGVVTTEKIIKN